jgi:23S rRNA (adenine2503-C2)-methyltransferase
MQIAASLWDLTPAELRAELRALAEPGYRADQLLRWAYKQLATGYEEMTDVPLDARRRLQATLPLSALPVRAEQRSADASTRKVLLGLADGYTVETVLMGYDPSDAGRARSTVCVSTQVGCAMGCVFCATGQQGFLRNLRAGEIVQQVLHFTRQLKHEGRRPTNVVFMGMGEPLANYQATLDAIAILRSPEAFDLGARRITVSTVGLVPMMRRLAAEALQIGLAVSLHSPDDELRRKLVPTARYPIEEILTAADEYHAATGRRYTIEYALIEHVNDDRTLAQQLAHRLRGRACHVNLIPINPTANETVRRPSRLRVIEFERILRNAGIQVTVRVEKGVDIAAGCGQLRSAASDSDATRDHLLTSVTPAG